MKNKTLLAVVAGVLVALVLVVAATQLLTRTTTPNSSNPASVAIASKSSIGSYLTNGTGFTLYVFEKDIPNSGTSACNGSCAATWPPFYTSHLVLPSGLSASSFGTITRADGNKQTTLNGHPLYFFAPDRAAGQTNGQGIGNVWFASSVQGTATSTHTQPTPGY